MKRFRQIIKEKRAEKKLYLREVSALMNIDQAILSKFERGERKPSKEQVIKFANLFDLNQEELLISWYSDNIVNALANEKNAIKILQLAEQKVKYLKSNK
ncbi:helix-turn-helix domain-containing protein [Aureispira anguillae]|uniref:Helix-turn-helix transcriptional regulator n=1 Tax=Aureispira anguillae TaxID=2864201 RepID=A0A915YM10_9BACT|nr:helix-turn-helix transcriptional regulator [Aureispira anguillae]BDS15243.1 helix-turn-helix transcriptional regulator [Aureispira anguillae]